MFHYQLEAVSSLPDILGDELASTHGVGFARNCVVHLGGYFRVQGGRRSIAQFMKRSGASAVSGYTKVVNFLGARSPGLALEANYFSEISHVNLATLRQPQKGRAGRNRMRQIEAKMQADHPDCVFKLWLANE